MPGVHGLLCDERGCPIYSAGPVSIKLSLGTLFGLQMLGGFAHKLGHQLAWILEFKKFILIVDSKMMLKQINIGANRVDSNAPLDKEIWSLEEDLDFSFFNIPSHDNGIYQHNTKVLTSMILCQVNII